MTNSTGLYPNNYTYEHHCHLVKLFGYKPVELVIFIFYHILLKFEFCGVYASGLSLGAHYVNKLNTVLKIIKNCI